MSTACQQLEGAALSLVRSGAIKDRLADAYRTHLAQVNVEELPEELRAEFHACQGALTREPPLRGEDAVRATVRKLSGREADELACQLLLLFAEVVRKEAYEQALVSEAALADTAAAAARPRILKAVPQVISLYAAEA
jgi:hypothetical protein